MNATFHKQYPALDRRWVDDVTRELCIRGANGRSVGEALATADAHCADSGESADAAFGPARTYAESVRLRPADLEDHALRNQVKAALPSVLGLMGMTLAFRTVDAHKVGGDVAIRLGDLIGSIGIVAISVIAIWQIRFLVRHPVLSWIAGTAAFLGVIALQIGQTTELAHISILAGVVGSGAALLGSGLWATAMGVQADPVLDPRPGGRAQSLPRWFVLLTYWLFPVLTIVACTVVLFLPRG